MKYLYSTSLAAAALFATAPSAFADCGISSGSVRILSNTHNAVSVITQKMSECENGSLKVSANLNAEHASIQGPALSVFPAEYTAAVIANGSLSALLNADLVRPLNDLVEQFGEQLLPNQLIRVNDEVVAIAFMANAQHFFYRADILEQAGLDAPTTYEDVVAAGQAIRDQGIMQYPVAGTLLPPWSLGQEFMNMYLGMGGTLFEPGSAVAAIDEEKAIRSLELLKELSSLMHPDYLTFNSDSITAMWEADEVAMANLWGSQASAFLPENSPAPEIAEQTLLAAAPSVGGNGVPATTIWWDGFAIAKNITDEDAEATFRAFMHGISPEMAEENPDTAVWLIRGYEPTPTATGILASVQGGAPSYPMLPYIGLLHDAFGANLSAFMTGRTSAEQVIADSLRDYQTSATQAGFLN